MPTAVKKTVKSAAKKGTKPVVTKSGIETYIIHFQSGNEQAKKTIDYFKDSEIFGDIHRATDDLLLLLHIWESKQQANEGKITTVRTTAELNKLLDNL